MFFWCLRQEESTGFPSKSKSKQNLYQQSLFLQDKWSCWTARFPHLPLSVNENDIKKTLIHNESFVLSKIDEYKRIYCTFILTSKISMTYSYFRAKSSSSGLTNWRSRAEDNRAPELINGLNGLSKIFFKNWNMCWLW